MTLAVEVTADGVDLLAIRPRQSPLVAICRKPAITPSMSPWRIRSSRVCTNASRRSAAASNALAAPDVAGGMHDIEDVDRVDVLDQLAGRSAGDDGGDLLPDAWAIRHARID